MPPPRRRCHSVRKSALCPFGEFLPLIFHKSTGRLAARRRAGGEEPRRPLFAPSQASLDRLGKVEDGESKVWIALCYFIKCIKTMTFLFVSVLLWSSSKCLVIATERLNARRAAQMGGRKITRSLSHLTRVASCHLVTRKMRILLCRPINNSVAKDRHSSISCTLVHTSLIKETVCISYAMVPRRPALFKS